MNAYTRSIRAQTAARQITSARILVMTGIALGIALGVVLAMILADYVFPAIVAAQLAAGS